MYSFLTPIYESFYYVFLQQQVLYAFNPIQPTVSNSQMNLTEIRSQTNEQLKGQHQKLTITREDLLVQGAGVMKKHWSLQQDEKLKAYSIEYNYNWKEISSLLVGRNQKMCYNRYRRLQSTSPCQWPSLQDNLIKHMFQVRKLSWKQISYQFPSYSSKQIRQHYLNFLRNNTKVTQWSIQEDLKIVEIYNKFGKKWKMFQQYLEGRTENQIKNRFYGRLMRLHNRKKPRP